MFEEISDNRTPPTYKFFNGSAWVTSAGGKTTEVHSPIDDSVLGKVQVVTHEEIDAAMKAAHAQQKNWEATPLNQRVKVMHLTADWIRQYEDYLTTLLIREIGKTSDEARGEIKRTADLTDYFADEVQSIRGFELDSDNFPGFDKGGTALIDRVAYGVVLAIAPFNYPVNLSGSKLAPALLMGNSVILKPPTQGSISGLHLTQLFRKAGVPTGVLATVTGGGGEIGEYLTAHGGVDMIAFTGNSETGMAIAKNAGMKPLLFECGGDNPVVVLPDADMHLTAREIIKGGFSYAGQRCTGIKYVLGTETTLDQLIPLVLELMKTEVAMGDPRSPGTKLVGPVISEEAAVHIEEAIRLSVSAGAKILTGGGRKNSYIEPTILTDVTPDMRVVASEVFGPVVSFVRIASMDEAVGIINRSRYGLQASVFTKDEGTGIVFARQLHVGSVQINGSPQRGPDHFPFLGVKHSGVGVQGVRYSLEAMSRLRPIVLNKPG